MTAVDHAFRAACSTARVVLAAPDVAARWDEPSALPEMTIGALAGHVSRPPIALVEYAGGATATGDTVCAPRYFATVLTTDDIDSDLHRGIRERGRQAAAGGPGAVLDRFDRGVEAATALLAEEPHRTIEVFGGVRMSLEDYAISRVVELVVHTDDLAVSAGIESPTPDRIAAVLTLHVMAELTMLRHGELEAIRALARRERTAAKPVTAF